MRRFINSLRAIDRFKLSLLLVLAFAGALFITAFDWGIPQAISQDTVSPWPVDTIAPVKPLAEASYKFQRNTDEWIIYPLFHYIVLNAAYAPYVAIQYLRGEFGKPSSTFPYGAKHPESFYGDLTKIARLVSLLMALGIIIVIYQITHLLFDRHTGLWAALLTATIAPLAYYAKTSNLDAPYLFWTVLAVWQCLLAIKHQQLRFYLLFGIFGALAIATKDQAFGFFVLTPFIFAAAIARTYPDQQPFYTRYARAFISKPILLTGVATVLAFALGNNLLFGGLDGFLKHLEFASVLHAENVTAQNPAIHTIGWQITMLVDACLMLAEMLGWGTLLLIVAGIVYAVYTKKILALILPVLCLAYYFAVLAPVGMVLSRYLLGIAILLTPFAAYLIAAGLRQKTAIKYATGIIATLCIGWQVFLCGHLNYTLIYDSRIAMEQWIRDHVPAGATIETQTQVRYLPRVADHIHYSVIANSYDPINYGLLVDELTPARLQARNPEYVLVLRNITLTGDPDTQNDPSAKTYYRHLLGGDYGYHPVAHFATPSLLSYKQITAGTEPVSILLKKIPAADNNG